MACFCVWRNTSTSNPHCGVQRNNSHERGRNQIASTRGLGGCLAHRRLLVSGETPGHPCPSRKARPYLLPTHPPSLPFCAKSSGQGSWLEWSSMQSGSGGVPRAGQFPVTVPRALGHHNITHCSLWVPVARSPRHLVFFFFFWLFSGICCLLREGRTE